MARDSEKVVLLCGGKGTRIREITDLLPKPMIPIGNKPILWHIMKGYSSQGYNDFILCLGYKGNIIKDFFINYSKYNSEVKVSTKQPDSIEYKGEIEDWKVSMIDTGEDSLTGKRLGLVRNYLKESENFLLTYGDGVSDVNIKEVLEFHKSKGNIATITAVHPSSKYGKLIIKDGMVESFQEKPILKDDLINGGFMVLNKEFLNHPMLNENVTLEMILEDLTKKKMLSAYIHEGCWYSMDSPADYEFLNEKWKSGNAEWKTWKD